MGGEWCRDVGKNKALSLFYGRRHGKKTSASVAAADTFGVVSDYIEKNEYVESLSCANPVR